MPKISERGVSIPKDEWVRQEITVLIGQDETPCKGPAQVLGKIAVHSGWTPKQHHKWAVTHLLCGLLICHVDTQEDAKRIAEWLWRNCRGALETRKSKFACRMIPEPIKEWVRECRRIGEWCDPKPFLETEDEI